MSILITIIILIVLSMIEQEEQERNSKPRIIGYRPITGEPIFNKQWDKKPIAFDIHTGEPIYEGEEQKKIQTPKKELTPEDKTRTTNSVLMITGAILIVFASIIFLATSWDVLPGIIKTLILIALQGVFFLFSYICKNTFQIDKTSKLFKYLGFIFLPIVLISLSCFELVGDYLSITGEGYQLFFGLSFIITNGIFYLIGKKTKDKTLSKIGYGIGLLGIYFVSINFLKDSTLPITIVGICNIILYLLLEKRIINKFVYQNINNITNYILIGILIILLSLDGASYATNLGILIYSIYYFIKHQHEKEESKQRRYTIYYLGLYGFSLTILSKIEIPPYFLYNLALIPLLLLTKLVKKENIKKLITYGILIISGIVCASAIIHIPESKSGEEIYYLLTFVVSFFLDTITYLLTKEGASKTLAYLSFTAIFMDIFYIVDLKEYMKYLPLITIILVYFLEILFDKLKDETSDFFFPIMIIIESILLIENYAVLIPLILMIFYIKLEHKDEALLIVPMLMSLSLFEVEKTIISQILCCILIIIYSLLSLNKRNVNVYTIISFISIFIGYQAFEFHPMVFSLLLVIWSGSHLFLNRENKFYQFATYTSFLVLYINTVNLLDLDLLSLYLPGFYLYLILLTQYLFKADISDIKFIDCFGIIAITVIGLRLMNGVTDAIIILFTLLMIIILSFIKKWNHILYTSLICMLVNIIFLTWEFWTQVPWYIYILIIGFALIGFAMFDEKRKQDKKKLQSTQTTNQDDMK